MHSLATTDRAPAQRTAGLKADSSVPFLATLGSEWSKFVTLRATWTTLMLALVLSVATTALLNWVIGWSWNEWSEADRLAFEPFTYSLSGLLFGGILFVVLGVNLVAQEYSSGMIRQTFTTTPRRGRVLAAKLIVNTAVSMVAAVITTVMVLVGRAVFSAYDVPTVSPTERDAVLALLGLTAVAPVFPAIGVAVAFLLRSAAAAITLVLALLFIPSMFGGLLPRRWQKDVMAWLPGPLTDSVSIGHLQEGGAMYKDQWVATAALVAWIVLILGGTLIALNRRDAG